MNTQFPEERSPIIWPVEAKPDAPKMPPSELQPRHNPDQPDDSPRIPTKDDLLKCLEALLPEVEAYVAKRFAKCFVQDAVDKAYAAGLNVIFGNLHDVMKPEEMSSASFRAWLFTVAQNAALTMLRCKHTVPLPDDDILCYPTAVMDDDERNLVLAAVNQLPPELRAVIHAIYFDKQSKRRTAKLLHTTDGIIARRERKAREALQAITELRHIFEELAKKREACALRFPSRRVS